MRMKIIFEIMRCAVDERLRQIETRYQLGRLDARLLADIGVEDFRRELPKAGFDGIIDVTDRIITPCK